MIFNVLRNRMKIIIAGTLVAAVAVGGGILTQQLTLGGSSDYPINGTEFGEPPLIPECEPPVQPEVSAFTAFKGIYTQTIAYDDRTLVRLENEDGGENDFFVNADTIVIDGQKVISYDALNIGDKVTGYYVMPQIMTMIYPPQVQVTVLVKESESAEGVYVDFFDENMLSSTKDLVLNINDGIIVEDIAGNLYTDTLENKVLAVFYSFKAMSYPAQASPNKIIVLDVPTQLEL